jgi:hypothetical protein
MPLIKFVDEGEESEEGGEKSSEKGEGIKYFDDEICSFCKLLVDFRAYSDVDLDQVVLYVLPKRFKHIVTGQKLLLP